MGNSESQTEAPSRPDGFTQLNDSIWELHRSEEVPEIEVIFFHGLQLFDYREAFWRTWRSSDDSVVWPKAWLGPSLRKARISSVSYDPSARQGERSASAVMYRIVQDLMQDVVLSSNFCIDQNSKVILVGHGIGGLIIKQLLLNCWHENGRLDPHDPSEASSKGIIETFLNNCRGVFYYSTPHGGSEVADDVDWANLIPGSHHNMLIVKFLKVLDTETARINNDFSNIRIRKLNIATSAIVESLDTTFQGLSRRVVREASARYDTDSYFTAAANHFYVCKPKDDASPLFTKLCDFCRRCAFEAALDLPAAPTHRPFPTVPVHAPPQAALEMALSGNNSTRTSSKIQSSNYVITRNSTSQPGAPLRPDGFMQLNNSVWELYHTEGVPEMEVMFFHGLQLSNYKEAFWSTWQSRDDSVVWPKAWLGPSLGKSRISSVSYDPSTRQGEHNTPADIHMIVEELMQDVVLSSDFSIDQNSKVILVGHSIGGLIIKHLVLQCLEGKCLLDPDNPITASRKERIETFLNNCRGVFYYSTPHGGSEVADDADCANHIFGANLNMSFIQYLTVLNAPRARMNNSFSNIRRRKLNLATFAIGEDSDTTVAGLSRRVVPEASARYDVDGYSTATANHFDVCKPEDISSPIFTHLWDFCRVVHLREP